KNQIRFVNTNALVSSPRWDIGLSKTGYIAASGRCLVMQMQVKNEPILVVLLNSSAENGRIADAQSIRQWLEGPKSPQTQKAQSVKKKRKKR
ncbi:MAG: peptidase S11, partial [Acidobacteriota bacterium]|nr:peptidase S11 [Acidobacteriota bacterium]